MGYQAQLLSLTAKTLESEGYTEDDLKPELERSLTEEEIISREEARIEEMGLLRSQEEKLKKAIAQLTENPDLYDDNDVPPKCSPVPPGQSKLASPTVPPKCSPVPSEQSNQSLSPPSLAGQEGPKDENELVWI